MNFVLKEKKKQENDNLLIYLRFVFVIGIVLLLSVGIAFTALSLSGKSIGSGIFLIILVSIFITLSILLTIFGLKLFIDLTRSKTIKDRASSFKSLKFTKFILLINISFIVLCCFFLAFAVENLTQGSFERGTQSPMIVIVIMEPIVEILIIWLLLLLTFYMSSVKSVLDIYEFVYWPLRSLTCNCFGISLEN